MKKRYIRLLVFAILLLAFSTTANAGIYEKVKKSEYNWRDVKETKQLPKDVNKVLIRSPRKLSLIDERYDPTLLIRTSFVSTMEDQRIITSAEDPTIQQGKQVVLNSTAMDPSFFGHREGFVLDNVEIGLKGRFNDLGLYYKAKFDMVPREKDGNRSSDYLKDAYAGWNYYSVFDFRIGRMKIPFSQANNWSTEKRYMINAPVLGVLTPKRQLGAMVTFSDPWQIVKLSGGVYNSVKIAIEQMKTLDQLMYVGRFDFNLHNALGVAQANFMDFKFKLGGNVAYTKENFDPRTEHRWLGFDMMAHLYIFTIKGEVVFIDFYLPDVDPNTGDEILNSERGWGWHADFIVHAWPEVIDVAFRIEQMDGDGLERGKSPTFIIKDLSMQKKMWITSGVTFHFAKWAKASINYIIRKEKEGYDLDNDVAMVNLQFNL